MEVGVIGLGRIGAGIATNLLHAGHQLTIFNRTREKAEILASQGAMLADKPGDACNADVVFTVLADEPAVEEIVFGADGLVAAMPAASIHVSISTIGPNLSRRLAGAHEARFQRYVAAPVFGRPDAAASGELIVLAGGSRETIRRCQPLFDVIGRHTLLVSDDPAAANVVQLSGNLLIASVIQSLGEATVFAQEYGIDPARYLEMMGNTLFTLGLHRMYGDLIADHGHRPASFTAKLGQKDLRLVVRAATEQGLSLPVANLLHDRLKMFCSRDGGELDWCSMAEMLDERSARVMPLDTPGSKA